MDFLPIFLDVNGQLCLVVGGGDVAHRKAAVLLEAGARCKWSHRKSAYFGDVADVEYVVARFEPQHLAGVRWSSPRPTSAVNRQVSEQAHARHIPVNVVDSPELCSFIMPSILDRSPLMVAFSSGGASPVLARMLRAKLEAVIPQGYGRLTSFAARFRDLIMAYSRLEAEAHLLGECAGRRGGREGAGRR